MKIGRGLISYVRKNLLFNLPILALNMSGRDLGSSTVQNCFSGMY